MAWNITPVWRSGAEAVGPPVQPGQADAAPPGGDPLHAGGDDRADQAQAGEWETPAGEQGTEEVLRFKSMTFLDDVPFILSYTFWYFSNDNSNTSESLKKKCI